MSFPSNAQLRDRLDQFPDMTPSTRLVYQNNLRRWFKMVQGNLVEAMTLEPYALRHRLENESGSINTRKALAQCLLKLNTVFGLVPGDLTSPFSTVFVPYFDLLKLQSQDETARRIQAEADAVPTWDEYLAKVDAQWGVGSKQYLVASLHHELSVRDDFAGAPIVNSLPKDPRGNYFVCLGPKLIKVVIHEHKTAAKRGPIEKTLSRPLSDLIHRYMDDHAICLGDPLFPDVSLSPFIVAMNRKLGYPQLKGVNGFRHMSVSAAAHLSAEDRTTLAQSMGHSVLHTQPRYVRQVAPSSSSSLAKEA